MKSKMISLLAAVAAFTAFGQVLVGDESPTNTNAETQKQLDRIKEELRVLAKSEKPVVREVTAYRIHLYKNADGREVVYVVGADNVERPVVLVDPLEYRLLTERLDAVWQSFHKTSEGRTKLHGKLVRTEINEKERKKVEIYADGFKYTSTIPSKPKRTEVKLTLLEKKIEEQKPKGMSDKRWEMIQAFKKHRQGVPKQVTVEHDAVTGKDTVVK